MSRRLQGDRGSASIWLVSALTLILLVAVAAILRGAAVLARHRAEGAADLAALAAAGAIGVGGDPCARATAIAAANGARLRSCAVELAGDGRSGTVAVRVAVRVSLPVVGLRDSVASARAGRLRRPCPVAC